MWCFPMSAATSATGDDFPCMPHCRDMPQSGPRIMHWSEVSERKNRAAATWEGTRRNSPLECATTGTCLQPRMGMNDTCQGNADLEPQSVTLCHRR